MSNTAISSKVTLFNLVLMENLWEYELDLLGINASCDELEMHLSKAPNLQSENAIFLSGYLSGLKI
jgi:hypothetical protein